MVTKTLSRRAFMQWSVLSTGAVVAAACAPTAAPAQPAQEAAQPTAAPQAAAPAAGSGQYKEAPMLADLVKAGKLPPVDERLPKTPLVVEPVEQAGTYGGAWRMLDSGDGLGYLCMTAYVEPFVKWKRDVSGHRPNLLESWEWNDKATELTAHFR